MDLSEAFEQIARKIAKRIAVNLPHPDFRHDEQIAFAKQFILEELKASGLLVLVERAQYLASQDHYCEAGSERLELALSNLFQRANAKSEYEA